jgi:RimJ/RimL family protein N-acetyltransferase
MSLSPVTLTGRTVRLAPLSLAHAAGLASVAQDEQIWAYMRYGPVNTQAKMEDFIRYLLDLQAAGTDLPFTVFHLADNRPAGMTRYMDIQPANHALEIGGTWYAPQYQHTGVNTECKYLLLRYAFETLGMHRVQIKTDLRNERSQRAIERIGAVREGVLREHMVLPDGFIRSSVYYSILVSEWPAVKDRLVQLMNRYPAGEEK